MKLILSLALVAFATAASAKPTLRDVDRVETGLLNIAVADLIREECPSLSGRVFKAMMQMRALANYAQSLGYTEEEIRTYVRSDMEKARMEMKRDAYLSQQGVVKSQPETYCVAGRAEIQKSTEIGALLRDR